MKTDKCSDVSTVSVHKKEYQPRPVPLSIENLRPLTRRSQCSQLDSPYKLLKKNPHHYSIPVNQHGCGDTKSPTPPRCWCIRDPHGRSIEPLKTFNYRYLGPTPPKPFSANRYTSSASRISTQTERSTVDSTPSEAALPKSKVLANSKKFKRPPVVHDSETLDEGGGSSEESELLRGNVKTLCRHECPLCHKSKNGHQTDRSPKSKFQCQLKDNQLKTNSRHQADCQGQLERSQSETANKDASIAQSPSGTPDVNCENPGCAVLPPIPWFHNQFYPPRAWFGPHYMTYTRLPGQRPCDPPCFSTVISHRYPFQEFVAPLNYQQYYPYWPAYRPWGNYHDGVVSSEL